MCKTCKAKTNMEEADRAQAFLLPAREQPGRIHLGKIGFAVVNRGGQGILPMHVHSVAQDICTNGTSKRSSNVNREAAVLDWEQLYAAPGLSVKPGGLGEVPWQPSKYAFLEEQPGYNPKGYKPTLRKNIEVQRERYTLCTSIDAASIDGPLATDTGPTLSVIFKADPKIRLANIADVSVSGPLSQALPREGFMASGSQEDEQMILAVRAYQDELYARQHRKWAQFLLQRWWSWVYRTSEWWRRCNEREVKRVWIYD